MKLSKKLILLSVIFGLFNCNLAIAKTVKKNVAKPNKNVKVVSSTVTDYPLIDKYIDYGNYADADKLINTAITKNPNDINALSFYIISQAKQDNLDVAQEKLNSIFAKNQNNANLHYAQAIINIKRQLSSDMEYIKIADKLTEEAIDELNTAIKLNPKYYSAYNALGVIMINSGDLDKANYYFNKALTVFPNYATATDNLGTVYYLKNDYDTAQEKFLKAISLNKNSATAYFHLAQVYDKKSMYSEALDALEHSLKLNPDCAFAYNLKGEILKKQGNEAAAISAFKKSIFVKPENTLSYINLANIYEKRFDNELAIANLKTALSVNPSLNDAKLQIADMSLYKGDYKQALKYYSTLTDIENYNLDALKGMANAYFEEAKSLVNQSALSSDKNIKTAYNDIEKAIAANPSDLHLYLAKLKIARLLNNEKISQETLDKIVNAPVRGVNDVLAKGDAYLVMNKYVEAKNMFENSVLFLKNPDDCLAVAEILIYNRFYPSAKNILRKILVFDSTNAEALYDLNYIKSLEDKSELLYKDAKFFDKKDKNKVFAREYALKSLEYNPTNYESALLSAKLCEKQKHYESAINSYKIVAGLDKKSRNVKKFNKKIKKLEKKLAKINNVYNKAEDKEFKKCQSKLVPDL